MLAPHKRVVILPPIFVCKQFKMFDNLEKLGQNLARKKEIVYKNGEIAQKPRAIPSKFQFSFPIAPKLPKSRQKYPPIFAKNAKKKHYFARAPRAGEPPGCQRHPQKIPAKIVPPKLPPNTTAKLSTHRFLIFHYF